MQRHIYGYQGKNIKIFSDDSNLAVNPSYIRLWLNLLSRTPRVAPFLSKNDPFILALKKVLLSSLSFIGFFSAFIFSTLTIYELALIHLVCMLPPLKVIYAS